MLLIFHFLRQNIFFGKEKLMKIQELQMRWDFLCQKHSSSESSIVWLMIIVWVGDAERIAMKRVQNIFEQGSGLFFFQKLAAGRGFLKW